MPDIRAKILRNNRQWSEDVRRDDPTFFQRLEGGQSPGTIWIGCSDSRVPAEMITGVEPGDLFVHRNVANQVIHSDMNCLSVLQYGVDILKVQHIIVCGHYGCGGVAACTHDHLNGLVDNWILHVDNIRDKHKHFLESMEDDVARLNRLCELNVVEQVRNVCNTYVVRNAWSRGQKLSVHGWVYGINNGLINDLEFDVDRKEQITPSYEVALKRITG